jgi:hypothetical protein
MSNPNLKYRIKLSEEQRQELMEISKNGTKAAKQVNHANVLLMADDNADMCGGQCPPHIFQAVTELLLVSFSGRASNYCGISC